VPAFGRSSYSFGLTNLTLAVGASVDRVVDRIPLSDSSKGTALRVAVRAEAVNAVKPLCEAGAIDPEDVEHRRLK
jgi:hypothetical protein